MDADDDGGLDVVMMVMKMMIMIKIMMMKLILVLKLRCREVCETHNEEFCETTKICLACVTELFLFVMFSPI